MLFTKFTMRKCFECQCSLLSQNLRRNRRNSHFSIMDGIFPQSSWWVNICFDFALRDKRMHRFASSLAFIWSFGQSHCNQAAIPKNALVFVFEAYVMYNARGAAHVLRAINMCCSCRDASLCCPWTIVRISCKLY